ncbi:MAG TPA: HAD-IA family hydrolase [Thermoanaerobaculia bacterium]|jgi:2-haloacid dehalogenase/putative hydrolase of the HAD superfamily|nr:HAD-IA family hydrolase [Thermoanaerobaculia bacterium]
MDRKYDIVTFDCYGTLIDWEGGISDAFLRAAREDGVELHREEVLRAYALIEPVVEREQYRFYRDVLTEAATRVAHALGWPLADERGTFLVSSIASWKPFPDTNPALERLRAAGYKLGILSNVDDDLLSATRRHFTVDLDLIVTAQQVHSYKPGPAHFLTAKEKIGDQRWLHAAQSNFHDIAPTNALGIPNAWVNRHNEKGGATPTHEVRDMAGLADLLI